MKTLIISTIALCLCAFAPANAQIFNIQLGGGEPLYVGKGADPNDTGTSFTQVESNTTVDNLQDQGGTTQTGVSFTISGGTVYTARYDDTGLLNGYVYIPDPTSASFSFSGLTADAGDSFTLYVYGGNDGGIYGGRDVTVSLTNDGDRSSTANGADPSNFSDPGNYTTITGTIGAGGTLTATATSPNGSGHEADLNGLQLDITAAPTTPEPSTWALMLGGLGVLAFVVRLRAAKA
jgi:hypothetical protein